MRRRLHMAKQSYFADGRTIRFLRKLTIIKSPTHNRVVAGGTVSDQEPVENFNNRAQAVDAFNYFDLNVAFRVNEAVSLLADVNNLTDGQPPVYLPAIAANTDPSTYDLVGRRYYVGPSTSFWSLVMRTKGIPR
jgi:hypothetical protein